MIGNQLTAFQINALVGQAAVNLRDACQNVINLQNTITAQGLTGLEAAPISLDSDDAAQLTLVVNYLNNVALVYFGLATVASEFDFDTAVSPVYGGQ
jgi:hypothetical protein